MKMLNNLKHIEIGHLSLYKKYFLLPLYIQCPLKHMEFNLDYRKSASGKTRGNTILIIY